MQQFSYKQLEDESFCVTGYEGDEAEVVIPSVIGGQPVTMLFDNIFKGHTEITSVTIPDTVNFLGGFVFDGCLVIMTITACLRMSLNWILRKTGRFRILPEIVP